MKKRSRLTLETKSNRTEFPEPQSLETEVCMNPWNGKCTNTDVALYIIYKNERLPICHKCWKDISSQNIEWTYD